MARLDKKAGVIDLSCNMCNQLCCSCGQMALGVKIGNSDKGGEVVLVCWRMLVDSRGSGGLHGLLSRNKDGGLWGFDIP